MTMVRNTSDSNIDTAKDGRRERGGWWNSPRAREIIKARDARKTTVPHPMNTDRVYSGEESMWLEAIRSYQARTGRKFPTYCEILAIAKDLGYRNERFPD
jgi:hypothetical protein